MGCSVTLLPPTYVFFQWGLSVHLHKIQNFTVFYSPLCQLSLCSDLLYLFPLFLTCRAGLDHTLIANYTHHGQMNQQWQEKLPFRRQKPRVDPDSELRVEIHPLEVEKWGWRHFLIRITVVEFY